MTLAEAQDKASTARRVLAALEHVSNTVRELGGGMLTEAFFTRMGQAFVDVQLAERAVNLARERARK
jgi:hypothetical protein